MCLYTDPWGLGKSAVSDQYKRRIEETSLQSVFPGHKSRRCFAWLFKPAPLVWRLGTTITLLVYPVLLNRPIVINQHRFNYNWKLYWLSYTNSVSPSLHYLSDRDKPFLKYTGKYSVSWCKGWMRKFYYPAKNAAKMMSQPTCLLIWVKRPAHKKKPYKHLFHPIAPGLQNECHGGQTNSGWMCFIQETDVIWNF